MHNLHSRHLVTLKYYYFVKWHNTAHGCASGHRWCGVTRCFDMHPLHLTFLSYVDSFEPQPLNRFLHRYNVDLEREFVDTYVNKLDKLCQKNKKEPFITSTSTVCSPMCGRWSWMLSEITGSRQQFCTSQNCGN